MFIQEAKPHRENNINIKMPVPYRGSTTFEQWTGGREISSWGTNSGAQTLPFQSWHKFKEAFAPEFVARAVRESEIPVRTCLDPFGGSGTTGLACQFLGVSPILAEVNPFIADIIESKLMSYDADLLAADLGRIAGHIRDFPHDAESHFEGMPQTFLEPGNKGRWIFDRDVGHRIASMYSAIEKLRPLHSRFFKVILGGILVDVSNVFVNGKGRRYRRKWESKRSTPSRVDELFFPSARKAIQEIHRYSKRACRNYTLLRGDSREMLSTIDSAAADLVVFSPPYPNSFDYTDVYNVELWALKYLTSMGGSTQLRTSTLSSHVQVARKFLEPPRDSIMLSTTLSTLVDLGDKLWDGRIPQMIGSYFTELFRILTEIHRILPDRGSAWIIVGDSRYCGVQVNTGDIIAEIASQRGWEVTNLEPFRTMRSSPQQGGQSILSESLVTLTKPG